jgi:putative ABC transport system permease protein
MIALVLAMVWVRRWQALTIALLSMFAVAAAVAAPAYLRATDRGIAAGQVATSGAAERGLEVSQSQPDRRGDDFSPAPEQDISFGSAGGTLAGLPGFDYVYAAEYPTIGLDPDISRRTRLVYRQYACTHLVLVTGRCLIGEADVILGEQTARRLHVVVGDSLTLTYAVFNPLPTARIWEPDGIPKRLIITGTYRTPHPDDPYWGGHKYFENEGEDLPGEPVFVNGATVTAMDHGATGLSLDGYAGPHALDVDRMPALRTGLTALQANLTSLGANIALTSQIPALLDRIDAGRSAAHLIVPVLAVPLVLLACLSIFLAVGYSTEGRRPELAVVALRGARRGQRWWLAIGENLVAIVVGAVVGCLGGQLLVNAVAAWRFPGVGADPGLASLRFAVPAAVAALLAALLAERRQLFSPVAELLGRVSATAGRARAIAVEIAIALLAVVAGVQLAISHGSLTGVGTFAAALIVLALALFATRLLLPIATRYGTRALRRGRLGVALAGFQLSRRAGAARLFALLVAAVAVAGYATCAIDVATRQRTVQAGLGTGADRVISVERTGRQQLLTAVRAVDPRGEYAMAAVKLQNSPAEPVGFAVDTTRLGAVAYWPDGAPSPAAVARSLRPAAPAPVVIAGQDLSLDITGSGFREGGNVTLSAVVTSVTGLGDAVVPFGLITNGRRTYDQRAPVCRQGCRLNALEALRDDRAHDLYGHLTVHNVGSINPPRPAIPAAQIADPARWRVAGPGGIAAAPDGLRIDIEAPGGLPDGLVVQPVDTPFPLPVATAGAARGPTVIGLDGRALPIDRVVSLPAVPRAGGRATMMDLEYADRVSTDGTPSTEPQVWLSAKAPADIVQRLERQGLVVTGDARAGQTHRQLDQQGPALALWFYVMAGCLATVLAAGALILAAAVDRARRVQDMSALRAQGLSRAALRQATLWTYPVLVAGAVLAGMGIALLGWWLTGWALPLAGLHPPDLPLPGWPRPLPMVAVAVAVLAVLACVAYLAGRRTLKEIA